MKMRMVVNILATFALLACSQQPIIKPLLQPDTENTFAPFSESTGELVVSVDSALLNNNNRMVLKNLGVDIKDRLVVADTTYLLLIPEVTEGVSNHLLNTLRELPFVSSVNKNQRFAQPQTHFNDLVFGASVIEGWWREFTGVEKAWKYSIGTGARAAYIDSGFTPRHAEYKSRLLIHEQANQTDLARGDRKNIELPHGDHGTASLLVGFAERDNQIPSVGVAPNAEVMPFVASNVWEVARALDEALKTEPDVVGMNFAFPLYPEWEKFGEYQQYTVLKSVFEANAKAKKIPIVTPAHNYGEPINQGVRQWVPVSWASEFEEIIPVGGAQIDRDQKISAWFSDYLVTGINARGSNHGPELIWAPALHLDIASTDPDSLKPGSMSGTSAACPFVTASVALLKSRFPEVSARRLREVLRLTGMPVSASALLQRPSATVPLIQVNKAIEALLHEQKIPLASRRAQRFVGMLQRETQDPSIPFVLKTATETLMLLPTRSDMRENQLPFAVGDRVEVEGWRLTQVGSAFLSQDVLELLSIALCKDCEE